jgi:hypothetical protein
MYTNKTDKQVGETNKRKELRIKMRVSKKQKKLNEPSSEENDKDEESIPSKIRFDNGDENLNSGMNNSEDGGPDKSQGNLSAFPGASEDGSSDGGDGDDDDREHNDQSVLKSGDKEAFDHLSAFPGSSEDGSFDGGDVDDDDR